MRDRLVAAFVGLAALAIIAFAVTTAYVMAGVVQAAQERKVEHTTFLLSAAIAEREQGNNDVTERWLGGLLDLAQRIEYVAPDGRRLTVRTADFAGAAEDNITRTLPVPSGGTVTVTRDASLVDQRVDEAVLPMVLVGLVLLVLAGSLGLLGARRLAAPFDELATAARRFGRGRFDLPANRYRIPEAEAIASALRGAAVELEDRIRREREFAANASHQLRTPITALRLDLEDLTLWPETPAPLTEQLQQSIREVDRLEQTVADLLDLARGERLRSTSDINLTAVVADAVRRWQPAAERAGTGIRFTDPGPMPVRQSPGPVSQILDVLLENALKHGTGPVDVLLGEPDGYLELRVRDQGTGPVGDEVFHRHRNRAGSDGEGIGLTVALEIAEALGGRLRVENKPSTTFTLVLPKPTVAASSPAG